MKKPPVKDNKIKKEKKSTEVILPDLNLKTKTVLNLFKDVDYDLNTVRYEKTVKNLFISLNFQKT